jgi:hypothetical protein
MKPGSVAKRDNEYERCGTANVFCGLEPQAGVHFTKVTPTRSSPEFADFIQSIANHYPAAQTIHPVMDNLSSHTKKALTDRFGQEEGKGAVGSVHRPLHPGTWQLAESGGTGDRPFFQAMFGETPVPHDPNSSGRSLRLEPANQPKSHHDQLDVRSKEGQEEVQIQVQN